MHPSSTVPIERRAPRCTQRSRAATTAPPARNKTTGIPRSSTEIGATPTSWLSATGCQYWLIRLISQPSTAPSRRRHFIDRLSGWQCAKERPHRSETIYAARHGVIEDFDIGGGLSR